MSPSNPGDNRVARNQAPPLVGHNVAFIATFVLSALGAHFLAYTITRRHDVSAVAAVA